MPAPRFTPVEEEWLRASGWFPGRDRLDLLAGWSSYFREKGVDLPPFVFPVLREFGGLDIGKAEASIDFPDDPALRIDPQVAYVDYADAAEFSQKLGVPLFPIGYKDGPIELLVLGDNLIGGIWSGILFVYGNEFDDVIRCIVGHRRALREVYLDE